MIKNFSNLLKKKNLRYFSTNKYLVNNLIDDNNLKTREKLKNIFKDKIYTPRYNLTLDEERDLAYKRLKKICESNVVSVKDFENNPKNIFTVHELAGMSDGSLCTKLTVQFNLFGGTLFKLGTEKHHKLINNIDKFNTVGCFGLTELGYGNNAVEMETTAKYDKETEEFVINTPSTLSQKYWITNGAVHAHYCIVFARLIMDNDKNEGLHGFLVPIRDKNLNIKENVKIWDMGYKIGLNGIDNAALWFNNVRIPKENLLDSTSQIINGKFESKIEDRSERKRRRFLVLADQLLSGRICIASMCLGSTKMVLDTTIRYAHSRKAVGNKGFSDNEIINYQLQTNELMPLLASTYVLNILLNYVQERYQNQSEEDYKEVVRLCCIIKPLVTWNCENTASKCRERCGGQGFLAANRFGEAINGSHAGITAEGDNRVILQKVAKELLDEVNKKDFLKYKLSSKLNFTNENIKSNEGILKLFKSREEYYKYELAFKMSSTNNIYDTWMYEESNYIQNLSMAYGERLAVEHFINKLNAIKEKNIKDIFDNILKIYSYTLINKNIGFYFENNLINKKNYKLMNKNLNILNKELNKKSLDLVDSFCIPKWMRHSPISNNWEKYNEIENNGELENELYRNN